MREALCRAKTRMRRKSSVALVALLSPTEPDRENIPIVVLRFVQTLFLDSLQSNSTHCSTFQSHVLRRSVR